MKALFGINFYPPFVLEQPRFAQDNFFGRWLHFNDVIDPRTLLVSKKRLKEAVQLLDDYKHGRINRENISNEMNRRLWTAQKIKQATFHPDTKEKIFMPFRMSGFVPFGSPIVLGLLLPNPSLAQTVFWQWLNQSHNACVNYANRNATKPTSTSKFLQGYVAAVSVAVSIAVSLSVVLKKSKNFKPATKLLVQRFIPFPAVSLASTCNVLFMRWHETRLGIEIFDSKGTVIGTSRIAAWKAVRDTAITRAFLPAPILLFPPVIMNFLEKTSFLKTHPRFHLPLTFLCCTFSFGFGLPLAIALFPQISKISREELELDIAARTQESFLKFNKGL